MAASQTPFDRIDTLTAELGQIQNQLVSLLTEVGREHQAVDAKYAGRINPLFEHAQRTFDELKRLAEVHKDQLLVRDKRSAKRPTGTVGWRRVSQLELHVPEDEMIRRLSTMSQSVYRKFVNRTISYALNVNALKANDNRTIVDQLEGLEVHRIDSFWVEPNYGLHMSSVNSYWPTLSSATWAEKFAAMTKPSDT